MACLKEDEDADSVDDDMDEDLDEKVAVFRREGSVFFSFLFSFLLRHLNRNVFEAYPTEGTGEEYPASGKETAFIVIRYT